ncbi:MAG: hypothetical protein R2710_06090 [Acidimicrobiales bacterium]
MIAEAFPDEPIVSADCDGQHTVNDIAKVADALATGTAPLVLGLGLHGGPCCRS